MATKKALLDIYWFLSVRHQLNFDGASDYCSRKGEKVVNYDRNGRNGIDAFFLFDSNGKIVPTKHPNIFQTLLKVKGSVNLHVKMWAEDRARGYLPKLEFEKLSDELHLPHWVIHSVEMQKNRYYETLNLSSS